MERYLTIFMCFFMTGIAKAIIVLPKQGLLYQSMNRLCASRIPNSEVTGFSGIRVSCACKAGYLPSDDHTRCKLYVSKHCDTDESCRSKHSANSHCGESSFCECNTGFLMSNSSGKCFPTVKCESDFDCQTESHFCNDNGLCDEKCSNDNSCYMKHGPSSYCVLGKFECQCDDGYAKNSTDLTCRKAQVQEVMTECIYHLKCWMRHGMFSHCGPDNRCSCNENNSPSKVLQLCIPDSIPSPSITEVEYKQCEDDKHCFVSLGPNSLCDKEKMCQCQQGYSRNGEATKCILDEVIVTETPTSCHVSTDCDSIIGENSVCQNGRCLCAEKYTYSEDYGRCLADQNFKNCKTDQYCQKRFDVNSYCNFEQKCACKDKFESQLAIPRCTSKFQQQFIACKEDADCKIKNSHCHDSRVCACNDGVKIATNSNETLCSPNLSPSIKWIKKSSKLPATLSIVGLVLLVLLLMCGCLYFIYTRFYRQVKNKEKIEGSENSNHESNAAYDTQKKDDEKPLQP